MITLYDITQAFRNASESDHEEFLNVLIPTFEAKVTEIVETVLNTSFDARLAGSELLKPIQRISKLECISGLDEDYNQDDEREPTIPERIQEIEAKINNVKVSPSEPPSIEITPKTKAGKRAKALITAVINSKKGFLTRAKIKEILTDKNNDDLGDARITEKSSNPRRDIIDALNEAERICSKVRCDKKSYGRHEWRLLKA